MIINLRVRLRKLGTKQTDVRLRSEEFRQEGKISLKKIRLFFVRTTNRLILQSC